MLLNIMLTSIKAKIIPMLTKMKLWLTPSYMKNRLLVRIRTFFLKLFDVKPVDEKDYYSFLGWLVSKKLAFAGSLVICILAGSCIAVSLPAKGQSVHPYKTYKYNSMALKLVSDKVQILGKSGYLAYVGDIDQGMIKGTGTLYDKEGRIVYEGAFDANAFHGEGVSFYTNAGKQYEGTFQNNLFDGTGKLYRENGVLAYEGEFRQGYREGLGEQYNAAQELIYTGQFRKDHILYQELLGKSSAEVAQMYTGKQLVYEVSPSYCVALTDIGAVYYGEDGSNSLEEEFVVTGVYVLETQIMVEGLLASRMSEVRGILGEPAYEGNTVLSAKDQVALNVLCDINQGEALYGRADLETTQIFDDVTAVSNFEKEYLIYMYVFEKEDITYTFFCKDKDSAFDYYLLEMK